MGSRSAARSIADRMRLGGASPRQIDRTPTDQAAQSHPRNGRTPEMCIRDRCEFVKQLRHAVVGARMAVDVGGIVGDEVGSYGRYAFGLSLIHIYFFHITAAPAEIAEGRTVTFELERSARGMNATHIVFADQKN